MPDKLTDEPVSPFYLFLPLRAPGGLHVTAATFLESDASLRPYLSLDYTYLLFFGL